MDKYISHHQDGFKCSPVNPNYKRRSKHHDYNRQARYMITLHSSSKIGRLSEIMGNLKERDENNPDFPHPVVSNAGRCIEKAFQMWLERYPQLEVKNYIIMPDHIHFSLIVKSYLKNGLSRAIASLMGIATRQLHDSSFHSEHNQAADNFGIASMERSPGSGEIGFGSNEISPGSGEIGFGSKEISPGSGEEMISFFEKGFNDKIAYNDEQQLRQILYIKDNPRRYLMKKLFPDLFYRRWVISFKNLSFIALGNINLLKNPDLQVVRFSRKYKEKEFDHKKMIWERCVENGGVVVSPFIHPEEKKIRDLAYNDGSGVIRICENGFSERFSPQGREFEHNSSGNLLLIAPLQYDSQKVELSYSKAQKLNFVAEQICRTNWLVGEGSIRIFSH